MIEQLEAGTIVYGLYETYSIHLGINLNDEAIDVYHANAAVYRKWKIKKIYRLNTASYVLSK